MRPDAWNLIELEDPNTFNLLLRNTQRMVRRLSLVDTPERYARNWQWVFGRRITGWHWLWIGLSYAHAGQFRKALRILRRKVLTWQPHHQAHAVLASYAKPVIEALEAGDHGRVREQLAQWEEMSVGEFRTEGVNLNLLY